MSVRVFAPAKINLTLEVDWPDGATGRHPLQSVVTFADVGDWVEASHAETLTLALDGPFAAALAGEADNLVLRAARALADAAGIAPKAALCLSKNLPVASGIGGGSADAAAALKVLNVLWDLKLPEAHLMKIGAALGGDVPVCVFARSAYMTGEGERVAPLELPPLHAVLANPGVSVATATVFQRFDASSGGAAFTQRPAPHWRTLADVSAGIGERGNMLAAPARLVAPVIKEVEAALSGDVEARCVSLSGSGATVFAVTETNAHAQGLATRMRAQFPNWWVTAATLALDAGTGPR